jgi:branched-chain amino acid transport system permease protein
LKGIYFAIATFGVGQLVGGIFGWWQNKARIPINIPTPMEYSRNFDFQYYSVLTATLATLFLAILLLRSKFGLALRMIGECEEAAAHNGVNTTLYKTLGFAISAFLMGLDGSSYSISFDSLYLTTVFSVDYSFLPPVMVLLGGVGTVYGSLIGPPILILLEEYLRQTFVGGYYQITYGIILVLIVLFAPNGIMGVIGKLKSAKLFKEKFAKTMLKL